MRRQDSNLRPPGYEPDELPTALLRDIYFAPVGCLSIIPQGRPFVKGYFHQYHGEPGDYKERGAVFLKSERFGGKRQKTAQRQVWNLFACGEQIMRAAACKTLSKSPAGVLGRLNGRKHSLAAVVYYSGICLFPELTDQLLPGGEKALNSPAGQQDRGNNFHLHVLLGIADCFPLPLGIDSVF